MFWSDVMIWIVPYLAALIVFLGLDAIWLGRIATGFYRNGIGHIMLDRPNLAPAALFYAFYVAAIIYFAVAPALERGGLGRAVFAGAVLGLVAYGTYDITNLATLRNWPLRVVVVDMVWGSALTACAAAAGFWGASFARTLP